MYSFQDVAEDVLAKDPRLLVFPLTPGSKFTLKNSHGFKDARRDTVFPFVGNGKLKNCNVGVTFTDDVCVIDVDGLHILKRLEKLPCWTDNTFTVKTTREDIGFHFYWHAPEPFTVPQHEGNSGLGKKVDTRLTGKGYVVSWGSRKDGRELIKFNDEPIQEMPEDLYRKILEDPPEPEQGQEPEPKKSTAKKSRRVREPLTIFDDVEVQRPDAETYDTNQLSKFAGYLVNTALSDDEVLRILSELNQSHNENPISEKDVTSVWKSILKKRDRSEHKVYDGIAVRTGNSVRKDIEACLKAEGSELRLNELLMQPELKRNGGEWERIRRGDEDRLYFDIQEKFLAYPYVKPGKQFASLAGMKKITSPLNIFHSAMNAISTANKQDPVMERLMAMPPWDKEPRVDDAIKLVGLKSDSPKELQAWAVWGTLGGVIHRAFEPGKKQDEMPILQGRQGCGKSTFWNFLLWQDTDWFSDSLDLNDTRQGMAETILGRVIVECAELQGMRKADESVLKTFLSRQYDDPRMAYQKYKDGIPRRFVLVGSTNEVACLPDDPTGHRRYIVVRVDGDDDTPGRIREILPKIRDQLWAEALFRVQAGEESFFPVALKGLLNKETKEHVLENDVLNTKISKALYSVSTMNTQKGSERFIKLADITTHMDVPAPNRTLQKNIADYLRSLGFEKKTHARHAKIWRPPTTWVGETLPF